jgi:hypothetical protein
MTMEITDFGFFKLVDHGDALPVILYFENEDGQDWYEMRFALTEWDHMGRFVSAIYGAWAMVDADGVVTNVEHDPSRLMPSDRRVLGIDASIKDVKVGMIYRDGKLLPAEKEAAE